MDILKREFKAVFKAPMEDEGFTYAGNCFYRHIGDVLQTLTLSRIYNVAFEFRFNIVPLCALITDAFLSGMMGPIETHSTKMPQKFHRPFDSDYPLERVRKQMETGVKVVERELFPIFRTGIDAQNAYPVMLEYHKKLFPPMGILLDPVLKWLALQSGSYDRAYIHQAALVAQNLGICFLDEEGLMSPENRHMWETITESDSPGVAERKRELVHIAIHDKSYFDPIIAENTKRTIEFLEKARKRPCKYGSFQY